MSLGKVSNFSSNLIFSNRFKDYFYPTDLVNEADKIFTLYLSLDKYYESLVDF